MQSARLLTVKFVIYSVDLKRPTNMEQLRMFGDRCEYMSTHLHAWIDCIVKCDIWEFRDDGKRWSWRMRRTDHVLVESRVYVQSMSGQVMLHVLYAVWLYVEEL